MTMCIQGEVKLILEMSENVLGPQKQAKSNGKRKIRPQLEIKKESKSYFCKKKGHAKKDCTKFKECLKEKTFLYS